MPFSSRTNAESLTASARTRSGEGTPAVARDWLQSPEGAVAYVEVLAKTMPPPVFEKAKGWLKDGIPGELFQHLTGAVPKLAQ